MIVFLIVVIVVLGLIGFAMLSSPNWEAFIVPLMGVGTIAMFLVFILILNVFWAAIT